MTRARTRIAIAIATSLAACQEPGLDDDARRAAFPGDPAGVDAHETVVECAHADALDEDFDDELETVDCVDVDPPVADPPPAAGCGFCAIDWKTLQFPGSVSISPVTAAPFDNDLFPMYPPPDKLPKLFEYDTKEKCEALGQATSFVRGKFWITGDKLPDDELLMVIKPELLDVPQGIVWKESGCPAGVETVDYALKDYVTTSDLEDFDDRCLEGIVCPNSAGIYRDKNAAKGWSCVSDSVWGTDLRGERIAVMCYPPAVEWEGYGPPRGITAKVRAVRESTPAPAYDTAFIVEPPPEIDE